MSQLFGHAANFALSIFKKHEGRNVFVVLPRR